MSTLHFDCPQGCDRKLAVKTPKVEGEVTQESLWDMEAQLGRRVMGAVMYHTIYECTNVAIMPPQFDKIHDAVFNEEECS